MRLTEAEAARLGIALPGRSAPRRADRKPAARPASLVEPGARKPRRKGRDRAACVVSDMPRFRVLVELESDPRPKGRPRTVPNRPVWEGAAAACGGSVARFRSILASDSRPKTVTYTPKGTSDYEARLTAVLTDAMRGREPFAVPVCVTTRFVLVGDPQTWPTSPADGDADNLEKAVWDAMNGVVFADDRFVVGHSSSKRCGPKPLVEIIVEAAAPSDVGP